jgi:cytochrome P450
MTTDLPAFPTTRSTQCPFDPPARYAELQASTPVPQVSCPAGIDAWLVTRYEDIRAVLTDSRLSSRGASSMHMTPSSDLSSPAMAGAIIQLDGAEHSRLRRLLISEFTVRRIEALRPYIQRITDEHIDAMLAGPQPADLVRDFALPIPVLVICELLGVPFADREAFQHDSAILVSVDTDPAIMEESSQRMRRYLGDLLADKVARPQDDLLSRLIQRGNETDRPLTMDELIFLGLTLLVAGHETTANTIALSTLVLLENPDQLAALRTSPELANSAVEELLRYLSVIQFGLLRYATEDVTVADTVIRAGEWLVAASSPGNRDESVYPGADEVDLKREARTHLAFGFGAHQCLGQQLARVELQVALTTLLSRLPNLRLPVPLADSAFKHNSIVYGLQAMPIVWDSGRQSGA